MFKFIFPLFIFIKLYNVQANQLYASTLFAPDGDSAMLFQLVTNTATQINELEQLVTNAQKHTELIEKYNQIAQDHYFRAERINYIAQSYVDLANKDTEGLEDLTGAIRNLKSETESLKTLINEYRKDEVVNEKNENDIHDKSRSTHREVAFANHQLNRTGHISSTNDASKLTAQNTALTYKAHVEGNQINQVVARKLSEQNKLINRQIKDQKRAELKRDEYYKLEDKGSSARRGEMGGLK